MRWSLSLIYETGIQYLSMACMCGVDETVPRIVRLCAQDRATLCPGSCDSGARIMRQCVRGLWPPFRSPVPLKRIKGFCVAKPTQKPRWTNAGVWGLDGAAMEISPRTLCVPADHRDPPNVACTVRRHHHSLARRYRAGCEHAVGLGEGHWLSWEQRGCSISCRSTKIQPRSSSETSHRRSRPS